MNIARSFFRPTFPRREKVQLALAAAASYPVAPSFSDTKQ